MSKEFGVPFIQGADVPLMKPHNVRCLARSDKRNVNQCVIENNWVLVTRSGTIGNVGMVSETMEGLAASEHIIRVIAKEPDYNPGFIALFLMTPYGQHQVKSKIYGAVVDELTPEDLERVLIPDVPKQIQDTIGNKVIQAFDYKEEANRIEDSAVRTLEKLLEQN